MALGATFRRAQLCLLLADGELIGPNGHAGANGAPLLVLSRELCRFHFFPALAGARRAQTEAAAALYCESHCPFEQGDSLQLRSAAGVSIWMWDRQRIEALLDHRRVYLADRILPESLLHPLELGWRHCALLAGYEAQYWTGGALIASMWRRRPFDSEDWQIFADSIGCLVAPPPPAPPEPVTLPLPEDVQRMPKRVPRRWGKKEAERAVFALGLSFAAFGFYAQGLSASYDRLTDRNMALVDRGRSSAMADGDMKAAEVDRALVNGFRDLARLRAPLEATADVFAMLTALGLDAGDWKVDDAALEIRIVPAPDLALVRDLGEMIEDHPTFATVSSQPTSREGGYLIVAGIAGRAPRPQAAVP